MRMNRWSDTECDKKSIFYVVGKAVCGKTVSRVLFLTRVKSDEQLRMRTEPYKFRMQTQDGDH